MSAPARGIAEPRKFTNMNLNQQTKAPVSAQRTPSFGSFDMNMNRIGDAKILSLI
jgi:hypothetical protein